MIQTTPVILCGGSGTRLWPRSRKAVPKPFLPLVSEETLFEATLRRCDDAELFTAPTVVAGAAHLAHIQAQSRSRDLSIIVEPEAKNTAAAIGLAAARLPRESIMLVCPSDHHIADVEAFRKATQRAATLASEGWLVALGIAATAPETGYGYILRGEPLPVGFRIECFVEKPDLETAISFVANGSYDWNGGIFAFLAGTFLEELERHRPELAEKVVRSVKEGREEGNCFHPAPGPYGEIIPESVDYAVMEETKRAAVVTASMRWSDIGNWRALHEVRERDASGSCTQGPVELVDCRNVLVDSDGPRVSAIGLEDVVIVVDGDEVLVTSLSGAQTVGKLGGASNQ